MDLRRLLSDSAPLAALRARWPAAGRLALSGASGPAALACVLALTADIDAPLLIAVPRDKDADDVAGDLRTLAAECGRVGTVLALPAPGPGPFRGLPRHPDAMQRRAASLHAAARGRLLALVASPAALLRPSLAPRLLETRVVLLRRGEEMTPEILLEALDEGGYRREDPVIAPGQIARRGGILDVFPPDRDTPVRLEFFGDTLESLRAFDVGTQRSAEALESLEILPLSDVFATRSLTDSLRITIPERFPRTRERDALMERIERGLAAEELAELVVLVDGATQAPWEYLPGAVAVTLEREQVLEEARLLVERARDDRATRPEALLPEAHEALLPTEALAARLAAPPSLELNALDTEGMAVDHVGSRPVRRYAGDLRALVGDLRAAPGRKLVFLGNTGRAERLADVLREEGLRVDGQADIDVRVGALSAGFELPSAALTVLADGDVFPEEVHLQRHRGRGVRSFLSDFRDLRSGDLVVHEDHGIGRYDGLEVLEIGGLRREFMVLAYRGGDKLKVPVEAFDRVQKYSSSEGATRPLVDQLGSGQWEKVKTRVKKAMRDMAAELLRLYAERKARPGHAFNAESAWQREFEEAFEYDETPDQAVAITDVARDMAETAPMDRLICGDVGYGKTEVAMRAAMRCVLEGKQVAVLAPTTVLAFQHWKTFRKRFAPFPVSVEMISRFRSPKETKQVLGQVAKGHVDILIGTHRVLSKDVVFRDIGLMIIDEEQRFGVAAKERLKQLRTTIDCLTLSATPIPRTLQMGLSGIRDMSVIETPPKDRLAIQTSVVKFSTDVIAAALRQELARDGQVYLVHNRVESIYSLAGLVTRLVPEARVAVAHGQMPEGELERSMLAFVEGRADVLVATTLIENGLDIPRANTLIVNRADRYGLAQLYQLRGRVGRSDRRAYAYLLVPPDKVLSEVARKRLAAMREFSELGAGFRIAALDLELRGAGNLLGGQQSGHVHAIGLDLYIKLLEQTILELKGEPPAEGPRAALNLRLDLRLPEEYVPDVQQRMSLYKRLSRAREDGEIETLRAELRDRYGAPPPQVEPLLVYALLRGRAERLGIAQVDRSGSALLVQLRGETPIPPGGLVSWVKAQPGASLTPDNVLRVPLPPHEDPLPRLEELLTALQRLVDPAGTSRSL
jgi:transcription-repair coupling factor (superfamily II helicase)